jgi:hypothetical protein
MAYESLYERFEVRGPDGRNLPVQFRRAGFLTLGDTPELYFFEVAGEEIVVGISGGALKRFEQKRRLSREEKIDLAGAWLKNQIEAGAALDSQNLFLRDEELAKMANDLSIQGMREP